MKTTIKNFTGTDRLDVLANKFSGPETVCLTQCSGSLRFQFDMTPEQAVELARALMETVGLLAAVPA
jgi:hypothetical protein